PGWRSGTGRRGTPTSRRARRTSPPSRRGCYPAVCNRWRRERHGSHTPAARRTARSPAALAPDASSPAPGADADGDLAVRRAAVAHHSEGVDMGELRGTHVPVLLERCLELLAPALAVRADRAAVHVDATVGLGGHAEAVLAAHPNVVLVGLDRDPQALRLAEHRLAAYADRTHLVHAVYDELPAVLDRLGISRIDGVLFDLGVSSLQLDAVDRGFSYAREAPLDMRMDQTAGVTAEEVVNTYDQAELTRILREYGDERFAARIAAAIVRERRRARIGSSARLAELVREAVPAPGRRTGGSPAERTFQALRIEVNRELSVLESAVPAAVDALDVGGRIVVLSYHSLEDR